MKAFWRGFFSIFDFSWLDLQPRSSRRIQAMMERSKAAQNWYHEGPWWEHPIYGDGFKANKDARRTTRNC